MHIDLMYQYFVKSKQKLVINRLQNHLDIYLKKMVESRGSPTVEESVLTILYRLLGILQDFVVIMYKITR